MGPSYIPPYIEIPSDWKNEQAEENITAETQLFYLDQWWQVFEDEKLTELELWAIENNRNLFVALERIQEARALMGIAAADFYPQITLNPLFTNTTELVKIFNQGSTNCCNTAPVNNIFREHQLYYFMPINISYEVDLWGKIRDRYQAAAYNVSAQEKDYQVVMLNLTSNLAMTYFQLRTADQQIDLLNKVIQTRRKALDINQARYEEEITDYSAVTLAAEEWESAIGQYLEIQRQRQILEDQIAVLIGVPASEFCLEHLPLQGLPPRIPAGIPSDVLLRRPDIAEAEDTLLSQHTQVKEAYSLFFPSLTLTAATGYESPVLKDFLKGISRYWTSGTEIDQLIFDGGKTPSNLDLQIARFKQSSGTYQQQVLVAFQEVEDALSNIASFANQYDTAQITTQWAQKTYQLYSDRYSEGVIYYIDVANTERDLLNYQISLNALQGLRYTSTIQLIKALGGGW